MAEPMPRRASLPILLPLGGVWDFPDPDLADAEGLLAVGGVLSPPQLLRAYAQGVFPWFSEGQPPLWWSPEPRALIDPEHLHVSRSLRRRLRRADYELRMNTAFEAVMAACGDREGGTWILPEMIEAYTVLHRQGNAHSFEIWHRGRLEGGLYGVQVGALFAAESMFHRATDCSKLALVETVRALFGSGIELMDVQFLTPHLASMGAFEVPRSEYLERVRSAVRRPLCLSGLQSRLHGTEAAAGAES